MRHPVSTLTSSRGEERLRGAMSGDVVGGAILPAAPEDSDPRPSEDADSVLMATAAPARALVDEGGPSRRVTRVVGEGGEGATQPLVARPAEDDGVMLAAGGRAARRLGAGRSRHIAGGTGRGAVRRGARRCGGWGSG